MAWNWQQPDWPEFTHDAAALEPLERRFLLHSGELIGAFRHIGHFHVAKAKFYERLRGQLNARQEKVIARMFREGIDGFKGGLSAENYISITKTSRATATRDLQELVAEGALTRTGELRHTRYHLNIADRHE